MSSSRHEEIDLSIVIVSYNTRELTAQCLRSILQLDTGLKLELIVVDNASPDGSAKALSREFPEIRVIESGGNHGFACANNIGFRASTGRYILCLNPDTVVEKDALVKPMQFLESHPEAAMATVRLKDADCLEEIGAMRFPSPLLFMMLAFFPRAWVAKMPFVGDFRYQSSDLRSTFSCDAIIGCFMMLPRWTLEQTGGFDDDFFMYGEEVEWCYRVRQAGHQIYYLGSYSILHYDGASTRGMSRWKLKTMATGQILAQAKMHGVLAAKLTNFCMIIGQVVRLPIWVAMAVMGNKEILFNNWDKLIFLCRKLALPVADLLQSSDS